MSAQPRIEHKSADRLAFEHYLRTGRKFTAEEWAARQEHKFNPYHDERGRFTFGPGSAHMGTAPSHAPPGSRQRAAPVGARRPAAAPPASAPRTRVAAMPGFPESGKTSWRSSNDLVFIAAADYYNRQYGLKPGDQGFRTPEFLKAWAMIEAGGEGNERAFRTDPFQVNKVVDWAPEKRTILGLRKGQAMTPSMSAYAALEWLRHKAAKYDTNHRITGFRDDRTALERYNANSAMKDTSTRHYVWYAKTITDMTARASARAK